MCLRNNTCNWSEVEILLVLSAGIDLFKVSKVTPEQCDEPVQS